MIEPAALIVSADEIDDRMGPIPGRSSDRIARELRAAAKLVTELQSALEKINQIRNSIIGTQTLNWSEHVYPLVAALADVGIEGMSYPEGRKYYGTLVERAVKAEDALGEIKKIALTVKPDDVPSQLAHIIRLCIDAVAPATEVRN
ncbi:hypothetical protein ACE10Z_23385 [Bradyrhizobium sp. Pha-3]|uniref:hypothetical protein n=1 Tax=Bradyrhizobium sp. Pha-3 TaxID=208375 RepID=UPI0035D3F0F2